MGKCVLWRGAKDGKGYGLIRINGRLYKSHRLVYLLFKGPLKKGFQVCHTCDTPACGNPDHLFLGTQSDNQKDSVAKGRHASTKKTHCKWGHPLCRENLYKRKDGSRECKECRRWNVRRHRGV